MGVKISQVFLHVTCMLAHGDLAQTRRTGWLDQKGPRDPTPTGGTTVTEGCWVKESLSPVVASAPSGCSQTRVHMGRTNWT